MSKVTFLFICLFIISCSEQTNINGYLVTKQQHDTFDILIRKAEIAYDQNNIDEALEYATKAWELDPASEQAGVMLGYVHLSKAGLGPFDITKALIQSDSNKTSLLESANAASALSDLAPILNISDQDILNLGDLNSGKSQLEYFKPYDVLVPKDLNDARVSDVIPIYHANKAISYTCPFVSDSVKIADEPRHGEEKCPASSHIRSQSAKAHFLWAISHLTEAIAFYMVLNYSTGSADKTNLELRVDNLNANSSKIPILSYLKYMDELTTVVDKIFPTSGDSMLKAVLADLQTATAAFAALAGIPDSLTSSISGALQTIQSKRDKVTSATTQNNSEKDTAVLKSQLTAGVAKALESKINDISKTNPEEFKQQKTEFCSTYDKLAEVGSTPLDACK